MNRSAFVVPVGLLVLSAAARAGLWLAVVGSASVVVLWLQVQWRVSRWRPVATALWVVTDDSAEGRHAASVAEVSFGDRRALGMAAEVAPTGSACGIAAADRLLDLVGVPDSKRPHRGVHVAWFSVALLAALASSATGSTLWLAVALIASTVAVVVWSWWRLVTRTRPEHVSIMAMHSGAVAWATPEVAAAQLLSFSYRPGVLISEVADFLERADLPLCERSRAVQRLARLHSTRDQRSATPVVAVAVLSLVGVVVPWIAW